VGALRHRDLLLQVVDAIIWHNSDRGLSGATVSAAFAEGVGFGSQVTLISFAAPVKVLEKRALAHYPANARRKWLHTHRTVRLR